MLEDMSLYHYFKPTSDLPTASQTGLPEVVVQEVNEEVKRRLVQNREQGKKWKYTTTFTPEDCAAIGEYAVKNGKARATKKFKTTHDVGESTVRSFKKFV